MSAPALDVLPGLRAAVVAVAAITDQLGAFNDAPSVHTRRPVPAEATYPMVVIGPVITRGDEDGVNDFRPVVVIDITTYGEQPTHYREVETIADAIYSLFHRQRHAFTVANWSVIDVRCTGPASAQADSESRIGRRVTLTIRLYAK